MGKKNDAPAGGRRPATDVVHLGRDPASQYGFVNTPVFRGSTVLFPTLEALKARTQPYTYGRRATPTTRALEEALTALAGGAYTMLAPSGLCAVTAALLAFVKAGDDILMVDTVYQPTRAFCDSMLKRLGVTTRYYDPLLGGGIEDLIQDNTRLVFVESPGSQTFEMQDLPAIAQAAHARGLFVLADNTWATPLFCKPLALGADVTIEAATKYIVGHADANLGAVTGNARVAAALNQAKEDLGVSIGSEEAFLALRGLRTLDVRLRHHMQAGLDMARWLAQRPEVARVMHPGLETDPGHQLWKRDYAGACGLFGFVLKPASQKALAAFLDGLGLFGMGYSWGGYESLIIPFDPRSYRTATTWKAEGPALRIHIGLDAVEDLKADLARGFERLGAAL
ncbi:MAG TPA: cystathionine beta-lyase [Hyphomicrobium sp.]|nr:cystathionine beta-lyase [Hyphomicrobium sp.]